MTRLFSLALLLLLACNVQAPELDPIPPIGNIDDPTLPAPAPRQEARPQQEFL